MKSDNQEQICIIFDESHKDVDITILKYFLQVLTPPPLGCCTLHYLIKHGYKDNPYLYIHIAQRGLFNVPQFIFI
jgi:hypothetical protein